MTTNLNGDGDITHEDRVGYAHWQDAIFGLIYSTGNFFGQFDENGEPKLTLYSERMITMWDKVIGLADSDVDFGIIPNPKFDEAQEDYITAPKPTATPC